MASNWKRKVSRGHHGLFGTHRRPRSTPALSPPSPASEIVRRCKDEAEKCLRDLEFEAGLLNYASSPRRRPSPPRPAPPADLRATLLEPMMSTSGTTTTVSSATSPDLLGTFCHLMNYVLHLRRENRHLRKQVLCLHEMRQIEQLQNELLRSACTCETGTAAARVLTSATRREDRGGAGEKGGGGGGGHPAPWRHSMPVGTSDQDEPSSSSYSLLSRRPRDPSSAASGKLSAASRTPSAPVTTMGKLEQQEASRQQRYLAPPSSKSTHHHYRKLINRARGGLGTVSASSSARSLLSPSLWCVSSPSSSQHRRRDRIRLGAEEELADHDPHTDMLMRSSLDSAASYSPAASISACSSLTKSCHSPMPSSSNAESRDASLGRHAAVFFAPTHSDSEEQSVFTEVNLPDYRRPPECPTTTIATSRDTTGGEIISAMPKSPSAGILARFGFKRPGLLLARRRPGTELSATTAVESPAEAPLLSPLVSKSMYEEKMPPRGDQGRPRSLIELPPDRWKMARKAFLKKRKRKISESDSLASSISGKSYLTIDLPDISYRRKPPPPPPALPLITTVDVDSRQWTTRPPPVPPEIGSSCNEQRESLRSVSQPQTPAVGLIRRMSQKGQLIKRGWLRKGGRTETGDEQRYFEKDDGRQDTVVEMISAPSWSASDISFMDPVGPRLNGPPPPQSPPPHPPTHRQQHREEQQAPSEHRKEEQHKLRSVTFVEQLSPSSLSVASSQQMTNSNDSVFASPCYVASRPPPAPPRPPSSTTAGHSAAEDVVEQLLILQERNSLLISTLKDKTREYERITERLVDLEQEVRTLRERHRFDANLEQLYNDVLDQQQPNNPSSFVPVSHVHEMEKHVEMLDHNIRVLKTEAYQAQQMALETHANDQATTMRYLNQIDNLQKANFHLLSKTLSELNTDEYPDIRRQLDLLPTYEALYSFTINLLRKLKHIRTKLLEKNFSVSKLDLELLQTQSSLLLAQAQIERQKMEMRYLRSKLDVSPCETSDRRKVYAHTWVRRTHSYHGQDILARMVNSELSFYLPFKLHGFRTTTRDGECKDETQFNGDEALELEFAKLFATVNRLSGLATEHSPPVRRNAPQSRMERTKDEETQTQTRRPESPTHASPKPKPRTSEESAVEMRARWRRSGANQTPSRVEEIERAPPARPTSCHVPPAKETEVKKIAEEIAAGRYFMSNSQEPTQQPSKLKPAPNYLKKAPPPLKLGNVGQVRAIAKAFDGHEEQPETCAPDTPPPVVRSQMPRRIPAPAPIRSKTSAGPPAMKPASHRRELDQLSVNKPISRIPVPSVRTPCSSMSTSIQSSKTESPYETLTFVCRERGGPVSRMVSPSSSYHMDESGSSSPPTSASTWSVGRSKTEAQRARFLYGGGPLPPSSPVPPATPPTPVPPTPTPPAHAPAPPFPELSPVSPAKPKKQSWFHKLRHKT